MIERVFIALRREYIQTENQQINIKISAFAAFMENQITIECDDLKK
tara:strand:- start:275 stop:412 length:138 start_codon:yes stop_codon:yes gene_type:complete